MSRPALVVMAAGMGSRYGGLKQMDPIGPNGEIIIDYSIYDALKAGFGKVVFIIKDEHKELFRERIGKKVEKRVETCYVSQRITDIPGGYSVPEGRVKPWGTAHAVLSSRYELDTPFAVINADDYYGPSSFSLLYDYLKDASDRDGKYEYCMVGFILENTLTEHGYVARGVCSMNEYGYLGAIRERTKVSKFDDGAKYADDGGNWIAIPEGSTVSMNMWGFTPSIFDELGKRFPGFFDANMNNLQKAEYFLPDVVGSLIKEGRAEVRVLKSAERWYGVTYIEDKPLVKQAIGRLAKQGAYPEKLWRND